MSCAKRTYHNPEYRASANEDGLDDVPAKIGSVSDTDCLPLPSWTNPKTSTAI